MDRIPTQRPLATHSSEILRGALETGSDVQVVRLVNDPEGFSAHLLQAEELINAYSKPSGRSESILDGIFAQSVIIVESEGDRLVYQAVWESFDDQIVQDVHFSQVGGTGGIAFPLRLYAALKIPVGVIADIDLLTDLDKLRAILEQIAPTDRIQETVDIANEISQKVRGLPPVLTEESVRDMLKQVLDQDVNWGDGGDIELRRELDKLSREIANSRKLKPLGTALPDEIRQEIEEYLKSLKEFGIFLVPIGELEDWLPDQKLGSRKHKADFAVAAATWIQEQGRQQDLLWEFAAATWIQERVGQQDLLWEFVGDIAEYFSQNEG